MTPKILHTSTMSKAKEIFLREIERKMSENQQALATLEENGYDRTACETLYKFAHTLKGSGQMVELWDIAESAAAIGTALTLVKDYEVELNKGILRFLKERMTKIFEETAAYTHLKTDEVFQNLISGDKKIMIVDDDPAVTELLKENLAQNGFALTICHDTDSAEKMLQVEQPDLIVLDILFPSGDGIEFCRRIRSNPQWGIVPVIFLTVKGELQDKLAGFSTGADDYLCKPFKVEELIARIQAILNRIASCKELVLQDELTKVYNRRYLQLCLTQEIAKAQQIKSGFSLAIIDVDHFKNVNDQYGHIAGDEVLQCLADKLVANLRTSDVICRYGGDEFVILMPETLLTTAYKILERVRQLITQELQQLPKSQMAIPLTFSIGVVSYPQHGITSEELLKEADSFLYRAKESGRNKVEGPIVFKRRSR